MSAHAPESRRPPARSASSPSAAAAAGHLWGPDTDPQRDARLEAAARAAIAAVQRGDLSAAGRAADAAELCRVAAAVADAEPGATAPAFAATPGT
jgi:hypothetical protein